MTTYTELLAGLEHGREGRIETNIPEDWMQGRTTYGGLTAALALESARQVVEDLPVRSAQVAFIGPVGGHVVVAPKLLRRGKNTAFVNVDLVTEAGVVARCIFGFGARRASQLDFNHLLVPDHSAPDDTDDFFPEGAIRPGFLGNFDFRLVDGGRPLDGTEATSVTLWLRHTDPKAPTDATAVLALADAPPPAIFPMMTDFAPFSSMTWMVEFLSDDLETEEGWWLTRSTAETAIQGYSAQAMMLWNRRGAPAIVGRQTVAVFG